MKKINVLITAQDPATAGADDGVDGNAIIIATGVFRDEHLSQEELNKLVTAVGETLANIYETRTRHEIAERKRNKDSDEVPKTAWTTGGVGGVGKC